MIRQGDSIENQVTGERLVFLKTSQETNGELVVVEAFVQPTGFVASEHLHPYQEERFHVLRGTVGFKLHRSRIYAGPGQRITVPARTPHKFWNAGEDEAHFECEIRPALQFEQLIETMFGLAGDGETNRKGMPNPLRLAVIARAHYDDVRLPFPRLSGCSGWDSPWAHRSGGSWATRRSTYPWGPRPRSRVMHSKVSVGLAGRSSTSTSDQEAVAARRFREGSSPPWNTDPEGASQGSQLLIGKSRERSTMKVKVFIAVALTALVATATATAKLDPGAGTPPLLGGSLSPDDRAFSRAALPALLLGADDRALPRTTVDIQPATPKPVRIIVHDGDFVWGDAVIGAGAGLGLFAVLLGAALAVLIARSRRRHELPAMPVIGST